MIEPKPEELPEGSGETLSKEATVQQTPGQTSEFPDANDTYAAQQVPDVMEQTSKSDSRSEKPAQLWTTGFIGLLMTQWLTAINDNVFRWLAIDIGKEFLPANPSLALTLGSVGFVAPFLILAAPAGFLADRFSKKSVIVICKFIEIVAMSMGLAAIWYGQFYLLIATVFLMGAQTALFSPSKLGVLPEFLSSRQLSAANGWMGLATMTATVIGMFVGGWLKDSTGYLGREQHFGWTAGTLLGIAAIGTVFSMLIPRTAPSAPDTRLNGKTLFDWATFRQAGRDIKQLFDRRALFYVAMGTVFFWTIAGVAQMNIDVLSMESGGALATDRTPLLISLVLGVAVGNVLAGFLSRGRIELGLVPIGCFIIILFGAMLSFSPGRFYVDDGPWRSAFGTDATWRLAYACCLLFGLGTGAGLYDVPLASYLQHRAPARSRGAILSATNFLVFGMMLLAFLGFNFLRAKTYPGDMERVPAIAALRTEGGSDPLKIDQFQQALREWRQAWDAKVASDLEILSRELASLKRNSTPEKLAEFRDLEESLKDKRPELPNWSGAEESSSQDRDQRALVAMAMHEELVARGLNEMQTPAVADDQKLKIDRTSFAEQYPGYERMAAEVYDQALMQPLLTGRQVFLTIAIITSLVFAIILRVLGGQTFQFLFGLNNHLQQIQLDGVESLGDQPVVLLLNDNSEIHRQLLAQNLDRPIVSGRWKSTAAQEGALAEVLLEPKVRQFQNAREVDASQLIRSLKDGSSVIVPVFEGRETRLSQPQPENLPVLLHQCRQAGFDIIPVSFQWTKDGQQCRIGFGQPVQKPAVGESLQVAFEELGVDVMSNDQVNYSLPVEIFLKRCRQRLRSMKVADSTQQEMTGGELLMRSAILWRLMKRHVLTADEQNVGVLIPPSAGGVLANTALALGGKTSVNLNYSVSEEIVNECIRQADIKHVLTTRKVIEKLGYKLNAEVIYLEELREKVSSMDKVTGLLHGYVLPISLLSKIYGLDKRNQDDVFTIIFTSGSTGTPKGVMLTNRNISCVVDGIRQAVHLNSKDVILGVLPFFHSFGFAVPLWTVLGMDVAGIYHFNPLDPNQIGKLSAKYGATILLATPTFLRTYMKRVLPEEFKTLNVVVAGAEKLPVELCDSFEEKYGVRPVEGYGATELSPLVSVNQPASRVQEGKTQRIKEGTVGCAIANVTTRVVDLDSGKEVPAGEPGMLWIKGPNVMKGYLGREDLTAEVIQDGWYNTGDVAVVDPEGFIHITGRLSRFSKIGGEMVPHILVEQNLNDAVNETPGDLVCAVTSAPDAKKGERLVVIHLPLPIGVDELRQKLIGQGVPSLFVPAGNAFFEVPELPMLGSGKLDLKRLKQMAEEKMA